MASAADSMEQRAADGMKQTPAGSRERAAALRERRWGRIQAASGLVFLLFAALHLVNQWLALLGPEVYDGFQSQTRGFYQNPALELTLVMGPLVVHVVAALRRMRLRGVRGRGGSWRMRLHRATGYFLLLVIFGHVAAVRGPSLLLGFFPGFEGISLSLHWMPGYFYVYYALFGASALFGLSRLGAVETAGLGVVTVREGEEHPLHVQRSRSARSRALSTGLSR